MEGIADADYSHTKRVWEEFWIKNLGEYHNLYVQVDKLLPTDVFENFGKKCIERNEPEPAHFVYAPELAWQAAFKKLRCNLNYSVILICFHW